MPTTKHWTTEPDGEVNIKTTLSGPASASPTTLNSMFKKTALKYTDQEALRVKRNREWKVWTWKDYYADVTRAAKSLIKLGLEPCHGVCILGFNAPEWFMGLLSAIMSGGFGVGVYPTNGAEACCHIANNCKSQVFIVEDKKQLDKVFEVKDQMTDLLKVIQYGQEPISLEYREQGVITWKEFLDIGTDVPDYEVSWRIEKQKPGSCASLIYTSGTTGPPKGVMISHDNLTWTARICAELYGVNNEDHLVSYLPLSHIAAQMIDILAPICTGATVSFAQPDALRGTLKDTLEEVHPTLFMGVPRVWEKIKDAVGLQLTQMSGFKKWAFDRASEIGMTTSIRKQQGNPERPWGYYLADKVVFQGVRKKLGLDRCRIQVTGAAPIERSVVEFFMQLDVPIYEMYGMSECTGPHCVSLPNAYRLGSCGKVMAGVEMKIDNPNENGDGEICFRGRHVFMGYLKDELKTRETIDEDGWLHSGDIGNVDASGFLTITGRIKEILITKGGENVAPVPLQGLIKEELPLLSHCCVIGNEQRYLTMLVTFKCEMDELTPTDKLSPLALTIMSQIGSSATTVTEAIADPVVTEYINQGLKRANNHSVSNAARVQKFRVCPEDFSIPGGELTPTMKMKRRIVSDKYADLITEMYEESAL